MNRIVELAPDAYTPEQRRMDETFRDVIGRPIRGPFAIWLGIPQIGGPAVDMFEGFRKQGKVERRLDELMVLIVARHLSAAFAWTTHEPIGVKHGLSPEAVEAIRLRQTPVFTRADEQLVYDITSEICGTNRLSDAVYDRAVESMGRPWLLELVAGIGFFHMIGITLNVFEMPAEGGRQPFD